MGSLLLISGGFGLSPERKPWSLQGDLGWLQLSAGGGPPHRPRPAVEPGGSRGGFLGPSPHGVGGSCGHLRGHLCPEALSSVQCWQHMVAQEFCGLSGALLSFLKFFFFFFFLMWTNFKVFIEFVTIVVLFYILVFCPQGMWDLASLVAQW